MSASYNTLKSKKGSIILAALIITLVTGALVGLFLNTVTQEIKNSYRARMGFQAVNLAEAGLEYAILAMITDDWSGWDKGGKGYYRDKFETVIDGNKVDVLSPFSFDDRIAKVYVQPGWMKNGKAVPVAVAEGTIRLRNGLTVSRQLRIEMQKGSSTPWKRGWGNGILGKDAVTFNGNKIFVDSYRSSDSNSVIGYPPGYDPKNNLDNGSVASLSVDTAAVSIGNADIYGRVATGGGMPDVGKNGSIYGSGQKKGTIDPDRIALDFYASIPDPELPTMSSPETSISGYTIGDALSSDPVYYELDSFSAKNKETFTVVGNVIMHVKGEIDIKGAVEIAADSSIEIYADGNVYVGGTGIANETGRPENFIIYGTNDPSKGTTTVKMHGSGTVIGVVHAPNSEVELKGGGSIGAMYGATVGESVLFVGNYEFHYDEDLADLEDEDDDDGKFVPVVEEWAELVDGGVRITDWATLLKNGFTNE